MLTEGIEMRISVLILLLVALALPAYPQSPDAMPMMSSVEPDVGKVGDALAIHGENLGQDNVSALYLTDGITDIKVLMIDQSATSIKFRIPPEAKPGRFSLMVLTKGKTPKLIEQPVKITVAPETTATNNSSTRKWNQSSVGSRLWRLECYV